MIVSKVVLNEKACVVSIYTHGHARKNHTSTQKSSELPSKIPFFSLCTAISTIEQQFFYALKTLLEFHPEVNIDEKKGSFQLELPNEADFQVFSMIPAKKIDQWKTLSQAFSIGYKMIQETYGRDQFQVTWKTLKPSEKLEIKEKVEV